MVRVKRVQQASHVEGPTRRPYDHYVAVDWSHKTMAVAHLALHDERPRVFERPTDVKELKAYLQSLHGRTILTVEESGAAHWLYLELRDAVERIVVCDPFQNRLLSHGPKTDRIDAGKLCDLLRAGLLKEVFHSDSALYELRLLVSGYDDMVRAGTRSINQQKALRLAHREAGATAEFITNILTEQIAQYREHKKAYVARFEELAGRITPVRFQRELHGIGTIGAVKVVATVVDARRFPSSRQYLSYCGLVDHEKLSGGRSYGRRQPRYTRVLKAVYKTAAITALKGPNPFREYYDHLRERGVADRHACHALARYIARVSYGMLKSGTRVEPYRWRHAERRSA